MRIGVVVVTHGQLAAELLNSAEMIVGDLPQFAAVSIGWHDDVERAREEIAQAIARLRQKPDGSTDESRRHACWRTCSAERPRISAMTFLETDRSR